MTKIVDCTRTGGGCAFRAEGETEDEVLQKLAAHAKNDHGDAVTPGLVAELRAAIRGG